MSEHITINIENDQLKPTSEILFLPGEDKPWIMQLSKDGGIKFNQEAYPNSPPDEFALAVIGILEHCFDVTFNRTKPPYNIQTVNKIT